MGAEKFSRYELREELGQGGMATVYRAYDPMFEREVALKILKRESLNDPQVRERFERETKIIARLEHAAIVPVYDVGRDRDQLFFVMRYMAGGSLIERIQSGTLSLAEIGHILQRLAAALDYAHSKGIIHRDLKPGNILFDEYDNAYISDFGIAKFTQGAARLTSSGIIGTPTHMSPEQAMGDSVDARSDIYSLGVILFEMLSGKTPFEATTPLGMAYKHATEPAPHIREINPNLPAGVEPIINKVLAKEREKRYASGAELADAFIATLSEPLPPDVSLGTPIAPSIKTNVAGLIIPPAPPEPPRRSVARPWMFGGVLALALAAFILWGVPRAAAPVPVNPPSQAATATSAPFTPTSLPLATRTPLPTETVMPTVIANPGIGGADKIALTANNDVYVMNIDGSQVRQLTNTNLHKFDLQWLPGGSELVYGEGNCVYKVDAETALAEPEELACFGEPRFDGFRVSPDGEHVAISIERRLLILPFDIQAISSASSAFALQALEDICLDYTDVAVKGAQWSADGESLAVMYQSVIGERIGDTILVLQVDMERCQAVDPLIMDEFPAKRFLPEGYERYPILPSYDWDGEQRFLFNTFKRNVGYGELYLYDMSTANVNKINPVDGACCYGAAAFSPDGTHILMAFQDVRRGAESETQLYYIPIEQIGTDAEFTPIRLPLHFFPELRENIQLALRPALP
ncbi:MAG TPA: protein kinase [Anaerolineales bacterium]|nr:protein kinase [Anaerolineales bacterium]